LYPLLKSTLFPTSPLHIFQAEEEARKQFEEVVDLVGDVQEEASAEVEVDEGGMGIGMGMKIDIAKARRELGIDLMVDELRGFGQGSVSERVGVDGVSEGIQIDEEGENDGVLGIDEKERKKGKKGNEKEKRKKLGVWRKELEDEYGAGVVVVLGDLAVSKSTIPTLYLPCTR